MLTDQEYRSLTRVFRALANETRLRILIMASQSDRPLHIKAFSRMLKKRYSAIYRHVDLMRKAGLITIYEVGRSRVVTLRRGLSIEQIIRPLYEMDIIKEGEDSIH
jgi:DNA-binding transcriptional ArsR family regulator